MSNEKTLVVTGLVVDSDHPLTIAELSRACCMHAEWVMELVDEGILEPTHQANQQTSSRPDPQPGHQRNRWQFSGSSLRRALVVRRLQRDLGINLAGAALALQLMDEMDTLRARLGAHSCR